MSLAREDATRGVRLGDIWRCCDRQSGECAQFQRLADWAIEEIRTIDAYRGNAASYHLTSVVETIDCPGDDLSCVDQMHGTYELVECCPIPIFRRNPTP